MGLFDKFLNVMRLNPDDEEEYYDDDYYDEEDRPTKRKSAGRDDNYDDSSYREKTSRGSQKITPMRPSKKQMNVSGMEVCVIKPTSVEDSREITETLLMNRTVVLNVEGLNVDIAQRIIDFTSGSCFAINGNLQKVTNFIFIITPATVDISGDFQDLVDSFDMSNLQTRI